MFNAKTQTELPKFSPTPQWARKRSTLKKLLRSTDLNVIRHYCLGPKGTNIGQVAGRFSKAMAVSTKSLIDFVETPEDAVSAARLITSRNELAVFWTCAVYVRENEIFFNNPDCLPFFFKQTMKLDAMQLAIRKTSKKSTNCDFPLERLPDWNVVTHPSPAPLISNLVAQMTNANSNAEAAERCAAGEGDACITTQSAKQIHGLCTVHEFGSPQMTFFGGITQSGLITLESILSEGWDHE